MTDIDRTAPVLVRHEVLIAADPAAVWRLHTDIAAWPAWNTDITTARLAGPLAEGATFHWHTHGLDIASTVLELVPGARIVWGGPAHGIDGVHVWTFAPADGGTLVTTEESWAGPPVDADPVGLRAALDASLTAWLGNLRVAAER
ncbi:SRPBCC family protein [Longispora urticae]